MKRIIILIIIILIPNISFSSDINVKKTKNHHLTAKPTKNHFMIEDIIVRAGQRSQKFILPHGSCYKQDCKWSAQRTERKVQKYSTKG